MPELPEVETVVRGLRRPLVGQQIIAVEYEKSSVIRRPSPDEFMARVTGQRVLSINRRAKYILCQLEDGILAVHLKMTGRLYVADQPATEESGVDRWVRILFRLANGQTLYFSDARRFGGVFYIHDIAEIAPNLGPEPLEDNFTPAVLTERLNGRNRQIKALLLEQSFIAGVGNIYADESLFAAKIHPLRRADTLTKAEIKRLHGTIRDALNSGIQHEGASINWYRKPDGTTGESQDHFAVYDREGEPCLRCGAPIVKIRVAQRGTHFCPHCQPERA
ncbi:MAG TPA: bifunctional DNA-formamidopyrimidine glycosylase/DNA-(apurinic or apyrimidinic site) lyase [Aggregatilineales bacterium]|nr:bifunctional DNA-formamidopyrimidine glycosylase/DNA-(apurinic or apyrimidinic site) lyase [Anaerolineae bacterium]HUN06850.1 bifunctional DNA-formamidopyrimidine glycosylase/DNA-(apurinic or apyrimidinic site) lyase [Aggregatilineales bacterium]